MKIEELFSHTFKALREQIDSEAIKKQVDFLLPSMPMVETCRAEEFDFFQPWIDLGRLTVEQMHHAAERYLLGKSKSGATIFWMIDDLCRPLDALIAPDTWISSLLKKREPLLKAWRPRRCLFGEHPLSYSLAENNSLAESAESAENYSPAESNSPAEMAEMTEILLREAPSEGLSAISAISAGHYKTSASSATSARPLERSAISAISAGQYKTSASSAISARLLEKSISLVESPVSAVILSELYPNSIWLSTVPNTYFTIDLLEPLRGRTIKVYPHTDAPLSNYLSWLEIADMARQAYQLDITVSCTLEDAASPSQKEREIDILQYLYELYSNPKE